MLYYVNLEMISSMFCVIIMIAPPPVSPPCPHMSEDDPRCPTLAQWSGPGQVRSRELEEQAGADSNAIIVSVLLYVTLSLYLVIVSKTQRPQ